MSPRSREMGPIERGYRDREETRTAIERTNSLIDKLINRFIEKGAGGERAKYDFLQELKTASTLEKKAELIDEDQTKPEADRLLTPKEAEALRKRLAVPEREEEKKEKEEKKPAKKPEKKEKTEDEMRKEKAVKLAIDLTDPELGPGEKYEPSPKVIAAIEKFLKERDAVLAAYEKQRDLKIELSKIDAEIELLKGKPGDPERAIKERRKIWIENQLDALKIDLAAYKKAQEEMKRELLADFIKKKGEYIKKNKEAFVGRYGAEYRAHKGLKEDHKLTNGEENDLINWVLKREVADKYASKVLLHSIYGLDLEFEKERARRMTIPPETEAAAAEREAAEKEKTRFEKIKEALGKRSLIEKLAVSTILAVGIGATIATVGPMLAGVWGLGWLAGLPVAKMGVTGAIGYSAGRGFLGAIGGALGNVLGQGIVGKIFGRKQEKIKERAEEEKRKLEESVRSSGTEAETKVKERINLLADGTEKWMTDHEILFKMAQAIDEEADNHRKRLEVMRSAAGGALAALMQEAEKSKGRERTWRKGVAIGAGIAGGLAAGKIYDAFIYPNLPEFPFPWGAKAAGVAGVPPAAGGPRVPASADWGYLDEYQEPPAGGAPGTGGEISGLADAPGGLKEYPGTYEGGYGDQPASAGRGAGAAAVAGVAEAVPAGPKVTMVEGIAPDLMRARAGDTIWRMTSEQLSQRFPKEWADFTPQQRNNLIANFIEKHGEKGFNLADFRKMPIGHEVDFKKLFGSTDIQHLFDHARGIRGGGGIASAAAEAAGGVRGTAGPIDSRDFTLLPKDQGLDLSPPEDIKLKTGWPEGLPQSGAKAPDAAEPGGGTISGAGAEDAVGRSYPVKPVAPEVPGAKLEAPAATTPFGTAMESSVAKAVGFSAEQYKAIKDATVGQLLTEIPVDDPDKLNDMWKNFGQRNPPNLPKFTSWNEGWEMQRRVGLADHIRKNLGISAVEFGKLKTSTVKIGDFLNEIARRGT